MRKTTILIVASAIGALSLTAANAQNQPAPPPDVQHHDQAAKHGDAHHEMHRDMHRNWHGHRHCTWKWRHHHRVRVCR